MQDSANVFEKKFKKKINQHYLIKCADNIVDKKAAKFSKIRFSKAYLCNDESRLDVK